MTRTLPSGALVGQPGEDVWIPSVWRVCSNCCGIKARRKNGVVIKIEGLPESPYNDGRLCAKGMAAIMSNYDSGHPKNPLIRTNPEKGLGIDPKWRRAMRLHRGIHFNSLVPYGLSQIDSMVGLMDACVRVRVSRFS